MVPFCISIHTREVKEAQREHKRGLTKRGTIEDLIKDLESD